MLPICSVTITDPVLPAIACRSVASARAVKDTALVERLG